jgi:4-diphosphocytidyl-2-C-methyl-D-erythritol kinase
MVIFPRAKINIGLRITEKRSDGFHNLQTIFYPVCLGDALEFVTPSASLRADEIEITGLLSDCRPEDNLVIKALNRLRERVSIPFLRIHLHKAIPAGAGLGGGSSDAACFIRSLNRHFGLNLNNELLKEIALTLGSDCPFFIDSIPAYAEGRGEILTPLKPLKTGYHLIMANPGINVNTKDAYRECRPGSSESNLIDIYNSGISQWKDFIVNDFEKTVFARYPQIASIKEELYGMGALFSLMSGSGSTVYGIFEKEPQIPEQLKNMIIYSGLL